MHREKQASVERYRTSEMFFFFVKSTRTIRMIHVSTKIIAGGSAGQENEVYEYTFPIAMPCSSGPLYSCVIRYPPTYLAVSGTDTVFHGIASPRHNKNAHTNNPCPIRVLWASFPWARFAVGYCTTRVLGRNSESM